MNTFFFYEPNATATRFSNKERFRSHPATKARVLNDNQNTGGIKAACDVDSTQQIPTTAKIRVATPQSSDDSVETDSAPETWDDCFDDAKHSDSGDSLRSLFSDFADELEMSLEHFRDTSTSHVPPCEVTPGTAGPEPSREPHGSEYSKTALESSLAVASGGQCAEPDDNGARPLAASNCDQASSSTRLFSESMYTPEPSSYVVGPSRVEKGTQTDLHGINGADFRRDSCEGVDQMGVTVCGDPDTIHESTQERSSLERHGDGAGGTSIVNNTAMNIANSDYNEVVESPQLSLPAHVEDPSDFRSSHHAISHSSIDGSQHSQYLPIHGFFTVHEREGQLAYTLSFFPSSIGSSLQLADERAHALPARGEGTEQYSNTPEPADNDDEDDYRSAQDHPLGADRPSSLSPGDGSSQQCLVGQKGDQYSPDEDALLRKLKGMNMAWTEIAKSFPGRSKGSLQTRYCTKLKRKDILDDDTEKGQQGLKRRRKTVYEASEGDPSMQLQCELSGQLENCG
ncbi:uncharacterized protein TRUGW13939_08787 [Talaromyces rugulosus]|uniref:Myb-like domain-containing protein n=1 Tax=Talaromyces rugulosus TaxID=121627 RepID=A0A7H8R7P0_TALRU|nr:uncharacterized protein TRUGW13939_08787 [Talaromyces rugulosus]QKX61635.1 hypothetical protein TRUGW13939_08787 [Talaromyces rugulosus]